MIAIVHVVDILQLLGSKPSRLILKQLWAIRILNTRSKNSTLCICYKCHELKQYSTPLQGEGVFKSGRNMLKIDFANPSLACYRSH
jgi:hypothetical protein